MKIAILGGGITGLTAAYCLTKKGHSVTLIEKESSLGGLASGFYVKNWSWPLERTYHHIFEKDNDILKFAKQIGFKDIYFRKPITASLHHDKNDDYLTLPLDTPLDLLRFPGLGIFDKLRAGAVIAFLKFLPFFSFYEKMTSENFLKKWMGKKDWDILWRELFRKKFGKYAEIILASFIWARIKKRTKGLGYIKGGFQSFIDFLEKELRMMNVLIIKNQAIEKIDKRGNKIIINGQFFDAAISTLPSPVFAKLGKKIFSKHYLSRFEKLRYLHAVTLIMETDRPVLEKTYWLNVVTEKIPLMIVAQHTNFADKKNYGNKHVAYVGWYVDNDSPLLKMNDKEILNYIKPYLKQITNHFPLITNHFLFKAPWAQPIFDKTFIKNKPDFKTPIKNFYIANLDMTYPFDRGTNYAVKLGKKVANLL